ncbi:MAG TPA: ECF transporter S component [Thermaerobacter sp.]
MSRGGARRLAFQALLVAIVAVATIVIQVPMPGTQGYVNIGDAALFVIALMFGPRHGLVAGGVGSALADLLTGYAHWAPWTLVIKGTEGWIAGRLGHAALVARRRVGLQALAAMAVAGIWMVAAYFVAGSLMESVAAALGSLPGNSIQGAVSLVLAAAALQPLARFAGRES